MNITEQQLQDLYELAVSAECDDSSVDRDFALAYKIGNLGGHGAVIRKLIDMVRAERKEFAGNFMLIDDYYLAVPDKYAESPDVIKLYKAP